MVRDLWGLVGFYFFTFYFLGLGVWSAGFYSIGGDGGER